MKKLIVLAAILMFSCSAEDESQDPQMCCDTTIEELEYHLTKNYEAYLEANPNMSETRRREIQAEYERNMEDPCGDYKEGLEAMGVEDCTDPSQI